MSLVSNEEIKAGDEITANYNYGLDKGTPKWYRKAHKGKIL